MHGQTQVRLQLLERGDVLNHAVHVCRLAGRILDHVPQSVDPDHASIDRPLVRVCRVIHRDRAGDGGGEVLRRDSGDRFVAFSDTLDPFVQPVAVIRARQVSQYLRRALGGVVPAGVVERQVPVSGVGKVQGAVGEKVDAVELFGLTLRLLELAAEQLVVAVDHQLKRCAACLQPLHLLLEGADFLLELGDVVGLHHALPDSAAQQQRRERLVVVVRDAILRQSSDFTISVEPGRGHIAEQFVDDAHLLLSARTQDLLAPGAGDAQGEGRLAAAPGVLGKVIQGVLKGAAGRVQNLVAIGCGDVDAGAVRHIAEEVDSSRRLRRCGLEHAGNNLDHHRPIPPVDTPSGA